MKVIIERYPSSVKELETELMLSLKPPKALRSAYFVKATQVDGQMAWASPVWHDYL